MPRPQVDTLRTIDQSTTDYDAAALAVGAPAGAAVGFCAVLALNEAPQLTQPDQSFRIANLRSEISGLHRAEHALPNDQSLTIRQSRQNMESQIGQTQKEIKHIVANEPPAASIETAGAIAGTMIVGAVLGVAVVSAIGARIRMHGRRRVQANAAA